MNYGFLRLEGREGWSLTNQTPYDRMLYGFLRLHCAKHLWLHRKPNQSIFPIQSDSICSNQNPGKIIKKAHLRQLFVSYYGAIWYILCLLFYVNWCCGHVEDFTVTGSEETHARGGPTYMEVYYPT